MTQTFVRALDCAAVEVPNAVAALEVELAAEQADKAILVQQVHRLAHEGLDGLLAYDFRTARAKLEKLEGIE